jgi:hypothetical protein
MIASWYRNLYAHSLFIQECALSLLLKVTMLVSSNLTLLERSPYKLNKSDKIKSESASEENLLQAPKL